jgi:hypothetical protein
MSNRIAWLPSTDINISYYDVYRGPTITGSWSFLATIPHNLSGANFNDGFFFYNDAPGVLSDYYRLDAVNTLSLTGTSIFQAGLPPTSGGNVIAWEPSQDPSTTPYGHYIIEASKQVSGPWFVIATVPAALAGQYYLSGVNRFMYRDMLNPYSTYYRIIDVDYAGHMSRPSDPFLTHDMPYFVPGSTPFGVFDNDTEFQKDADRVADYVRKKLGEPVMEVHMSSSQIYAAFEEACLEYSAMVNSYQAQSVLGSFLGAPTGSLSGSENTYVVRTLTLARFAADPYAEAGDVNSRMPHYSGSIDLEIGKQSYDIPRMLFETGQWNGTGTIVLHDIYHKSPMQAYRFFGTTSGLNYLNNQFRFESFTPETLFYLLPVWEDILRGMQFKTSNTVRRSNYSYDLHNNTIRLFPVPQQMYKLWFTYSIEGNPVNVATDLSSSYNMSGSIYNPYYNGVSNMSNIPFGNIQYSKMNSLSRNWIRRMALAYAKEIEGQIRSKMATIPIPNGDLTLNGPELITDARSDMELLRGELKELLGETTYQKLMEKEAAMAENLQNTWKGVPMGIFIG